MTADVNQPFSIFRVPVNVMESHRRSRDRTWCANRHGALRLPLSFGSHDGYADTRSPAPAERTITGTVSRSSTPPGARAPRFHYGLSSNSVTTHDDIATARYTPLFQLRPMIADTLRYARYEFSWLADMPNSAQPSYATDCRLDDILVDATSPPAPCAVEPHGTARPHHPVDTGSIRPHSGQRFRMGAGRRWI